MQANIRWHTLISEVAINLIYEIIDFNPLQTKHNTK